MIYNELKLTPDSVHFQTITMFVYYDEIFDVYFENANMIYWYWFPNTSRISLYMFFMYDKS